MTIERDSDGNAVVECDRLGCNETITFSAIVDFGDAWKLARNQGWRAVKYGKDWVHGCPKHAGDV